MNVIEASDRARLAALFRGGWMVSPDLTQLVADILADVRRRGDAALVEMSRKFDDSDYDVAHLRVPIPMHDEARHFVTPEVADALHLAKGRVARFHERQRHADLNYVDEDGTRYGFHYRALESIAAYVHAGPASSPSSVIMSVVPAKIAGVTRAIVLTPPQADGRVAPAVLFACSLCGVDELYAVGGAHAIAAAAYGTQSIAPVDKIVGPGNAFVTEAKRQVFGVCGIDALAGPSEVMVVADDGANSEYVVGELLAQAERDQLARVAVVSESRSLLDAVAQLLDTLDVGTLPHGEIISEVMARACYLIHANTREETLAAVEAFAPEHLSLMVRDAQPYLKRLRHVGGVFVGDMTPVASGDYLAGVNRLLPTSGAARFSSGLSLAGFMRTFSVVENSRERMMRDAQPMAALAELEGLPQHAQTARMRWGA
ncbi:MAG: histidinol dehydrogenase [Candidatus Baltobacteraceae bacterium]